MFKRRSLCGMSDDQRDEEDKLTEQLIHKFLCSLQLVYRPSLLRLSTNEIDAREELGGAWAALHGRLG
eukprot:gene51779-52050_t